MDRFTRLTQLWSWLPAFRAVAETEHLPTAARQMNVTPSTLSRAVSQLEQALGYPLFARVGRGLRLEPAGRALRDAVRDAMRRLDDGLDTVAADRPIRLRVAGDGVWIGAILAPACADAAVELEHVELPVDLRDGLLRGTVDLALVETVTPAEELLIERLGTVAQAVCSARRSTTTRLATCTTRTDDWPAELARGVRLRSARLDAVLEACREGAVRAVLPVALARTRGLQQHATPRVPSSQLYLVRRHALGTGVIETVVPAIRARATRLLARR